MFVYQSLRVKHASKESVCKNFFLKAKGTRRQRFGECHFQGFLGIKMKLKCERKLTSQRPVFSGVKPGCSPGAQAATLLSEPVAVNTARFFQGFLSGPRHRKDLLNFSRLTGAALLFLTNSSGKHGARSPQGFISAPPSICFSV